MYYNRKYLTYHASCENIAVFEIVNFPENISIPVNALYTHYLWTAFYILGQLFSVHPVNTYTKMSLR